MTRFAPDLASVKAGMRTLTSGEWELLIKKAQPVYYVKDDGTEVAGCRYMVEVVGEIKADGSVDEEFAGDTVAPIRLYIHTPKSFGMTKQFILAAMGYTIDQEEQADSEYFVNADFSIDVDDEDNGVLGSSWTDLEGKHVRCTASTTIYNGRESQEYRSWTPIS